MRTVLSFNKVLKYREEMSATWVFAIMVVSIVCLGITVQAEDDGRSFSTAPAPSPSNQLPMSHINTKVYACGERCVNSCMKEAGSTRCTLNVRLHAWNPALELS